MVSPAPAPQVPFLLGAHLPFSSCGRTWAVAPIPRRRCVKHKSPFCCSSRLPWLVLPAAPSTLAGHGCVQKGTGVMSAGPLEDLSHPWDSSAPRTGVPTDSNLLLVLLHCFFFFKFLHCGCFASDTGKEEKFVKGRWESSAASESPLNG